ncbi:single-stranded DNA-binding protein [Lysinibacillus sp. BF-4]|uniref:single-stranded DNA-binding protein n=1 Tax=Lysinibacillus sp. BF-4 TaxID=1473546 RepID=UPI000505FCC2|nr:single-stranded DNA-binding protein [Lysinibacillus sp. BF-4]KFL42815.1 single-stranded DNA-binding protein [Lysinibacillus sp. BF-4]
MNHVGLVGRTTKHAVLRELAGGKMQTNFSLAINRTFKNQQGEFDTDFVLCVAWGKLAETIVKHCGKGSLIGVSGRIQSRNYDREDGTRVFMTEVVIEDVRFYQLKPTEAQQNTTPMPPVDFLLP